MAYIQLSKKLEIEEIVTNILENNKLLETCEIDIVKLVKKDGFVVQTSAMPIGTTGCLLVNDDEPIKINNGATNKLILINKQFSNPDNEADVIIKKSRFITAHEYGHYILHKNERTLYAHRDSDKRDTEEELEADYFARSILMPWNMFGGCKAVLDEMSDDASFKLDVLSKMFKVTHKKVLARLEDLQELARA